MIDIVMPSGGLEKIRPQSVVLRLGDAHGSSERYKDNLFVWFEGSRALASEGEANTGSNIHISMLTKD